MGQNRLSEQAERISRLSVSIAHNMPVAAIVQSAFPGLSMSQMHILSLIDERGETEVSMSEMAREMAVTMPSVTGLVDQLTGRGLVSRRHDDQDRRRVLVGLTAAGRKALDDAWEAVVVLVARLLEGISEGDRESLVAATERVHALSLEIRNEEIRDLGVAYWEEDGMKKFSRLLGEFIERHSAWVALAAALIAIVGVFGATKVQMRTSQDMFISKNSKVYQDYLRMSDQFGGQQVLVLLSGDPSTLLSQSNLTAFRGLQDELTKDSRIQSVVSPLTFIQSDAEQAVADGTQSGSVDALSVDPQFAHSAVFDSSGQVLPQLTRVIPDNDHVLIAVTLAGGLTTDEENAAAASVRDLVKSTQFSNANDVIVAGTPLLMQAVQDKMKTSMGITLAIAVVLMVVALTLIFPVRWRWLSLPIVLIGVLCTFGLMGYIAVPITMVTMAGLPILIGLGVDYAIQLHNRYEEEILRGDSAAQAVIDAITHIGPAVGIAVFATVPGFLALLVSKVPMIRDFGVMLSFGVVILFAVGLFLLNSILYQRDKRHPAVVGGKNGQKESRRALFLAGLAKRSISNPTPIIGVAILAAAAGFWLDHRIPVQTDVESMIPTNMTELVDLNRVRAVVAKATSVSFLVEGDDVTNPDTLRWMQSMQAQERALHPELLSDDSLASAVADGTTDKQIPSAAETQQILAGLPDIVRSGLVSADGHEAVVSFGIPIIPIGDMNKLIDQMEAEIQPPSNVDVAPAGTTVLMARTVTALTANRNLATIIALLAVAGGLLLVYRRVEGLSPHCCQS